MDLYPILLTIVISIYFICLRIWLHDFSKRLDRDIKAIKDKEYEEYLKRQPTPQIISENKNVIPLYARYNLPWSEKRVTENDIHKYLVDEIAKNIDEYVEIISEKDIVRGQTCYMAKLDVVDLINGTTTYH